jgi:hypothetical protein
VLTYSSETLEKSYEDPDAGYSVWGSFLLDEALWRAETVRSPRASVQEAFEAAAPRAHQRTVGQRSGPQTPVLHDGPGEPFHLEIEPAPARPGK